MAENTEISWCDHTLNLWWGCTEVHAGCDNCYAKTLATRWGFDVWGAPGSKGGVRRVIQSAWKDLDRYQRNAAKDGVIRTVFVGSMMDIFEKPMPMVDGKGEPTVVHHTTGYMRQEFFDAIDKGKYPNLLFLLLTKRPSNINKYIPESWRNFGAPNNVMFGTSVVNQETADKLIPQLLGVKGKWFLSMEPLLGPVNLKEWIGTARDRAFFHYKRTPHETNWSEENDTATCEQGCDLDSARIDWLIVGGESGHHARPMHPDWAQSIQKQCTEAGVKFHFKQWGEWIAMSQAMHPVELADGEEYSISLKIPDNGIIKIGDDAMVRSGKKAAGRLLDGKEYNALATD